MSHAPDNELQTFSDRQLLAACRVLFGHEVELSRDFLWYLQPEGAKCAYRKRAKERHPDAHPLADDHLVRSLQDEFNDITQAYHLLNSFLHQRGVRGGNRPDDMVAEHFRERRHTDPGGSGMYSPFGEQIFRRTIPGVEIKTARYLYLRGFTSFTSVLQALTWQRRQRPSIGVLARQWGWLNDASVMKILRATSVPGRFGERAIKMGLLSERQNNMLLSFQRSSQQRIGRYFVLNGIVNERQLEMLITELTSHNRAVKLSNHHS